MQHKIDKIALFALTSAGASVAAKLAEKISDSKLILPEKLRGAVSFYGDTEFFPPGTFSLKLKENWSEFNGHIFVMATGIVVRQIAGLLTDKTKDPAVVVCDEKGEYAVSLLSGHIGGANRLAKFAASVLNGQPVITTATDVQGLMAFDEMAAVNGWKIANPEKIKVLNSMLLQGRKIALFMPEIIYSEYYSTCPNIVLNPDVDSLLDQGYCGAVVLAEYGSDNKDETCCRPEIETLCIYKP